MVQGWRPYSATNQPISHEIHGSGRNHSAQRSSQRRSAKSPFTEYHSAAPNSASIAKPSATMMRKVQNSGVTLGSVSRAARSISSGVTSSIEATYFFSSRPDRKSVVEGKG